MRPSTDSPRRALGWLARLLLAAPLLVLALPAAAPAEIYKWVDAEGRLHYTTDLSKVPARQRLRSEQGAREREASDAVQRTTSRRRPAPARRASSYGRTSQAEKKTYTIRIPPGGRNLPVMVELNDSVMAPFIIDTGATHVAVPRKFVEELGIETDENTPTQTYHTANGVIESQLVTLDSVSIGGARVEDVQASVSDSLPIGLLGLSYFNHFEYRVDSARGLVHLTPIDQGGDAVRGGRTEAQWRGLFTKLRKQLQSIQEEIERTPASRSRKLARLGSQRASTLERLAEAEAEADHTKVPFAWRR